MRKKRNKVIVCALVSVSLICLVINPLKIYNTIIFTSDNSKHLIENWVYKPYKTTYDNLNKMDINVVPCWRMCRNMETVLVGVVDTGIDSCTIEDNVWVNCGEIADDKIDNDNNGFVDDCYGWDFYNQDKTLFDNYVYDHHGTYVANTIVSVAPNVKICNAKFISTTYGDSKDCIAAIKYVISQGAEVVNCSWSFGENESELFDLIQSHSEVLFVCAAGNANINLDNQMLYPACYELENVICVSSMNMEGGLYDYCACGKRIDIVAPGENVAVILPEFDCSYVDGTSVSSAFVTGAAALLKGLDKDLTSTEIKQILIGTAKQRDLLQGTCKANGSLDIGKAVKEVTQNE